MMRSWMQRGAGRMVLLILGSISVAAQTADHGGQADPEKRLWREIEALAADAPASQPYAERLATLPDRWEALVERARSYLLLYPGGSRRDDAIRLELSALFELGSLRGGDLDALRERVAMYLAAPPSEAARDEAAYWRIYCDRAQRTRASTQPASAAVLGPDVELLAAYRAYIREYPHSRHVLRMATVLFDESAQRGDIDEMKRIVQCLSVAFPNERATAALGAALRREQAIGQAFWISGRTSAGAVLDSRSFAGRPVVIVVWASFDPMAVDTAATIERRRVAAPDIAVIGVNLDERVEDLNAAAEALQIAWPQVIDGLGWAGEFVTNWGVRCIPSVFVIARDGKLLGVASDERWGALLDAAVGAK